MKATTLNEYQVYEKSSGKMYLPVMNNIKKYSSLKELTDLLFLRNDYFFVIKTEVY